MSNKLQDAMKTIDKVRKSLEDSAVVKSEDKTEKISPDVKAQEEATKSEDPLESHIKDVTISDEKVTKKDEDIEDPSDDEEKGKDSAEKSKTSPECDKDDKATKSDDEVEESTDDKEDEKSEKSESDPEAGMGTDAKVEEAKAKQPKKIDNVEDVEGHEEVSKSLDTNAIIGALTKSVDTMAEIQKSYKELAESAVEIAKSVIANNQVEKSVKDTDEKSDDEVEESADKNKAEKAEKSEPAPAVEKSDKSVEQPKVENDKDDKSAEQPEAEDDKAEKSIPVGKAVAGNESDDTAEKSVDTDNDVITVDKFEDVVAKSIANLDGYQNEGTVNRQRALKSLLNDTRALNTNKIPDDFIERYNRI